MAHEGILIANATAAWKSAYDKADKLFSGLDDEDLSKEVAPQRSRLIYLWGHLTAMHDRMLVLLGLGERVEPSFDAIFLTSPDRASELPSVDRIRDTWKQVSDRLNKGIAGITAKQWLEKHTAVSEADFGLDPLRNCLSILLTRTNHLSYHLGQANLVKLKTSR